MLRKVDSLLQAGKAAKDCHTSFDTILEKTHRNSIHEILLRWVSTIFFQMDPPECGKQLSRN